VLSNSELEGEDELEGDDRLEEFSHQDYAKACKMLGRTVPVAFERQEDIKKNVPRARPAFLNKPAEPVLGAPSAAAPRAAAPAASAGGVVGAATESRIFVIYRNSIYGMRADNAEDTYALTYPGQPEAFQYWDLRLAEGPQHPVNAGDICLELFFFGELKGVSNAKFGELSIELLHQKGFKATACGPVREAGCMYPLIAVPISVSEDEATNLGQTLFDDFGNDSYTPSSGLQTGPVGGTPSEGGAKPECVVQ
jgi:hypothetical protein